MEHKFNVDITVAPSGVVYSVFIEDELNLRIVGDGECATVDEALAHTGTLIERTLA